MAKSEYLKYVLSPEIKNGPCYQTLEFKGKDARGYDFSIFLAAIGPESTERAIPESVDADRCVMYLGGEPAKISDLSTEIEISMGDQKETRNISSAAVVYIPKGQTFRNSVLRKPEKVSWLYSITLPPKYIEPE